MKGKFEAFRTGKSLRLGREEAEAVALGALGFLGADEGRLARFLDAAGLAPGDLRAAAAAPGFLAGVLDHVMSEDALVLGCAEALERPPEAIVQAWTVLAGPGEFG